MTPNDLDVEFVPLRRRVEFDAASALYRRVFGYDSRFSLNSKLMLAMNYAGGANVGAWSRTGELVGFVYGFPAIDHGGSYLFSQAACVDPAWRGRGIGTALKHAQLAEAKQHGLARMRWAFDPANLRNGRINIDKLGARARWFKRDFYDDSVSDRLIAEWDGTPPSTRDMPTLDASPALFGRVQVIEGDTCVVTAGEGGPVDPGLREALAESMERLLGEGMTVTRCAKVAPGVSAYLLERAAA